MKKKQSWQEFFTEEELGLDKGHPTMHIGSDNKVPNRRDKIKMIIFNWITPPGFKLTNEPPSPYEVLNKRIDQRIERYMDRHKPYDYLDDEDDDE